MNSNGNEKIEVHDASILRSNEHPKFKIGDVINNGYGDFTVKGFTRSFMGLAYVLDNGSKIICWLTEQVDAKCHLVERKQNMNNNYPIQFKDKIDEYLWKEHHILGGCCSSMESVKYAVAREVAEKLTDTFIEKAVAYLNEKFYFNNSYYAVENDTFNCMEEMFEDFKEYLKK